MSASLPAATAFRRGHSSSLWSFILKQAAHALSSPDDPEADGPEAGGSAAGGPASVGGPAFSHGLCFFGGGLGEDPEDELSDEGEDGLRRRLPPGVTILRLPSNSNDMAECWPVDAGDPRPVAGHGALHRKVPSDIASLCWTPPQVTDLCSILVDRMNSRTRSIQSWGAPPPRPPQQHPSL